MTALKKNSQRQLIQTLILGLGNDLLADDGIGVFVAAELEKQLAGDSSTVVESTALHGLALLDHFIGFRRAILIDAIKTGEHPVGSVLRIDPASLRPVSIPSPHYAGLPEMLIMAKDLELDFPEEFIIFAVEVGDTETIGGAMSAAVKAVIPVLCEQVIRYIETENHNL